MSLVPEMPLNAGDGKLLARPLTEAVLDGLQAGIQQAWCLRKAREIALLAQFEAGNTGFAVFSEC
jgi:hypothetical protein